MERPPTDSLDAGAVAGRHEEPTQTVRVARLVALLKGEGLNRSTAEELLRPESLSALRGILTDHLFGTGKP